MKISAMTRRAGSAPRAVLGRALRTVVAGLAGLVLCAAFTTAPAGATGSTTMATDIAFPQWHTPLDFAPGRFAGTRPDASGIAIARPIGTLDYTDPDLGTTKPYDYATWTSRVHGVGFGADQLVASWNATTPAGTWLQVEMRGTTNTGAATAWYVMGRWASGDADIHRTSVPGQSDATGSVDVDTFSAADGVTLRAYQLRVTLYRAA